MDIDERWKEVSRIFDAALERPGAERAAFVAAACGTDEGLRREVESLLGCDSDASDLLTIPAGDVMAKAMDVMADAMAADASSLIGRQVGHYRIDARLGAGGMGEVYKATDTRLLRPVALKILPTHLRDPHLRRRFDQEAQAVAAVRHPHICVLHDIGQDGEIEFLVMEYLEGETLAERLTRGPLPVDEAFRWATDVADALVATHQQRITHRDLKPGNVMLTTSGAKLLDFGLATLRSAMSSTDVVSAKPDSSATPVAVVGTPSYMAPEQVQGQESDHRTDIFAFGALLYEMVTGRKAFDGKSRSDLAAAIMTSEPAPMPDDMPSAARRLEPLIRRCLAKDPNERWQNTSEMASELRQLASDVIGAGASVPAWRARGATPAERHSTVNRLGTDLLKATSPSFAHLWLIVPVVSIAVLAVAAWLMTEPRWLIDQVSPGKAVTSIKDVPRVERAIAAGRDDGLVEGPPDVALSVRVGDERSWPATNAPDRPSSPALPVQSAPVVSTSLIADFQREATLHPVGTGSSSGDRVGGATEVLQMTDSTPRTTISGLVFEVTSRGRVPIANGFVSVEPDQEPNVRTLVPFAAADHPGGIASKPDEELWGQLTQTVPIGSDGRYTIKIPSTLQGHLRVRAVGLAKAQGLMFDQPCAAKASMGSDTTLDIELVRPGKRAESQSSPTLSGHAFETIDGQQRPVTGTVRYSGPGGGAYVHSFDGSYEFCNTGIGQGSVVIFVLGNGDNWLGKSVTISGDTSFDLDLTWMRHLILQRPKVN